MNNTHRIRFMPLVVLLAAACATGNEEPSLMHYGDTASDCHAPKKPGSAGY